MSIRTTLRGKVLTLVGTVGLLGAAAFPLMGMAQDASPAATPVESNLIAEGEQIYNNVCIACHQPDGKGIAGIYLPLNGNPLVTLDDPTYLISTIITGRGGMPTFAGTYNDEQIAAIATYVRQNWDNDAGAVTPEEVAAVREEITTTPILDPTPEGQIPSGNVQSEASAEATP